MSVERKRTIGVVMADDSDEGEGTGRKAFDLTKQTGIGEDYFSAADRLAKEYERLSPSLSAITKAYETSGLESLSSVMDTAGMNAAQQAIGLGKTSAIAKMMDDMTGAKALAEATRSLHMPSVNILADLTKSLDLVGINAAAQQILDVDSLAGTAFARLTQDLQTGIAAQAMRAIEMPGLQSILGTLDTGGVGRAIADANLALGVGLPATFGQDLQSAVGGLASHMDAIDEIGRAHQAAFESFRLTNLEALLAKSLAVHEALLEEQQQATLDAKAEAKFNRRLAVVLAVINIIMFLMSMVGTIEDWMSDEDAATKANTAAIAEMRDAFDAMANEMEAMRAMKEAEAKRQSEADAEIAGILRDIANALGDRSGADE